MRTATGKVGVVFMLAAASLGVSQAPANADPVGQKVVYTLTSTDDSDFDLYYLVAQPPSKDAYNADAYAFVKKETVVVGPDTPWRFETTLADPQWAIFTVSSTTHGGRAAPNPTCDIAIDGVSALSLNAPYSVQCQLSKW